MLETFAHTNSPHDLTSQFDLTFQLLTELALGQRSENVAETLKGLVPTVGLKHVAALRFAANKSDDATLLAGLATYSKDWQVRYFVRRYHEVDPIVLVGITAASPFDWQALRQSSPKTSAFFADAAEHGAGVNGVTIPVRNRPNGFGLVSFASDLPDLEWGKYKQQYLVKLQVLACLLDSLAQINVKLPSKSIELSRREEQALLWAARGKTSSETANIMNISYASVRTYIETARHKLSCVNVTHAVAVAIATGLIPAQALKGTDPRGYSENAEKAA